MMNLNLKTALVLALTFTSCGTKSNQDNNDHQNGSQKAEWTEEQKKEVSDFHLAQIKNTFETLSTKELEDTKKCANDTFFNTYTNIDYKMWKEGDGKKFINNHTFAECAVLSMPQEKFLKTLQEIEVKLEKLLVDPSTIDAKSKDYEFGYVSGKNVLEYRTTNSLQIPEFIIPLDRRITLTQINPDYSKEYQQGYYKGFLEAIKKDPK